MTDADFMTRAIELAVKGRGKVSPNPMVGAVIAKNGKILGEGWHQEYGGLHAERNAIKNVNEHGENAEGAVMYVTLEPCCHFGKTPPCTDAIIESKISRVVIGSLDPNPLVAGKGAEILRNSGIEVTQGVLQEQCNSINTVFMHYITTGMPYVVMKYAMTLDGKIAAYTGKSKWITGEEARNNAHKMRGELTAIMVGVGTVLNDDPMLTCRTNNGKNPIRIVCDTNLRTPVKSKITDTSEAKTIIATCVTKPQKHQPYLERGCEIITLPVKDGRTDIYELMQKLGERKIDSVLLEGGAELNYSAVKAGVVNRIMAYISPKLLGGAAAKSPIGGIGIHCPNDAIKITSPSVKFIGDDILVEGGVCNCSQEL